MIAYLARNANQPLSELMALSLDDLQTFARHIGDMIEEENEATR